MVKNDSGGSNRIGTAKYSVVRIENCGADLD